MLCESSVTTADVIKKATAQTVTKKLEHLPHLTHWIETDLFTNHAPGYKVTHK